MSMSSRVSSRGTRSGANAKAAKGKRAGGAEKEVEASEAPAGVHSTSGTDVGQSKVLGDPSYSLLGLPRVWYYRYTLMTGVYMLDWHEVAILHFFMILGVFFALKYSYAFWLALNTVD